jgi:5-methylcytosine-specific restriction endonuclease McrA
MENMSYFDNQSIVSELTDNSDTIENFDVKIEEIKSKLTNDLNKLNIDLIKEKCKELGITGLSKLKKPELIQLLETEFFKMQTYLNSKSKNELKLLCKNCDIKKISATKKDYLIYQILLYNANNMIFKIVENTQQSLTENASDNQQQLSLIEQLEKQKQEIELKMQEEIKKKEEENRRLLEEEEKKRAEEEKKRLLEEEEKKKAEEERKRIEDEKREAKKKKQSIPKNVRIIVWNHYIGEDIIKHKCLCCKKVTISNTNFEVGHVLSEKNGGTHEINNLRPICFACNHSMGAENMIDFVVKFGLYIG